MGQLDLDRNADPVLNGVFGHQPRVGGRPAGHNDDLVDLAEDLLVDVDLVQIQVARLVIPAQQRVGDRRRVLVDLLVHEGIPSALFGGRGIPIDGVVARMLHRMPLKVGDHDLVPADADGLVLPQLHGLAGICHEGRHIGAQVVLSVPQTDHQRRIMSDAHHQIRLP